MSLRFLNYIFAAFMITICSCMSVLSQNECNLQISVYEYKENGSSEQFPVQDAKINLIYTKTGKDLKRDNSSAFSVSSDGEYRLIAVKEGFQKTIKLFSADCSLANAENIISEIVFLRKGNTDQIFELQARNYDVGGAGNYYKAAGEPINDGAVSLGKPSFPAAARAVQASGKVEVQVTINELGYVISAKAVSGHPLLRAASVKAAKESKFRPTFLDGYPVKVTGIIVYNFVP